MLSWQGWSSKPDAARRCQKQPEVARSNQEQYGGMISASGTFKDLLRNSFYFNALPVHLLRQVYVVVFFEHIFEVHLPTLFLDLIFDAFMRPHFGV